MLNLEEIVDYLEDKNFLRDPENRHLFIQELVMLMPECYREPARNVTFFKMIDETTMMLDSPPPPYVWHDEIPLNAAKDMFNILNKIDRDSSSYVKVSSLRNMIYIKYKDELWATQFKGSRGYL